MTEAIMDLDRAQRRRLRRLSRKTDDADVVRRALAIVQLGQCETVVEASRRVQAARSSVYRWKQRFENDDVYCLKSERRGPEPTTVCPRLVTTLHWLLERTPSMCGYLSTRWTSKLLAKEVERLADIEVHPSTIRRLLPRLGYRWRRARPTLHRRDPDKAAKLEAIHEALEQQGRHTAVFFVDEVAIELNPRIGYGWTQQGQQVAIETPGQNQKRYLAGALHASSGKIVAADSDSHNSELLIELLDELRLRYRGCQKIFIILDNAPSHRRKKVQRWFDEHSKFEALFQPTYHPWVNRIERLWKQLHETVTLHHRRDELDELMDDVWCFLDAAEPFPGGEHRMAELAA